MQLDTAADLELLSQYQNQGDTNAFNVLMQRYSNLVFNTALRILRDRSLAEDATQETFYRLMRRPEQVSRCVPAWLHRAATHLCLDMLRANNARRNREQAYQTELQRKRDLTPESWDQVLPQLDTALSELPEDTRQILVDHFLMGKSQRQLAEDYSHSPATMSRRMKSALEDLRKKLSAQGISLSISPLFLLLTNYQPVAVPELLASQLGKLAMFSSTASTAASASAAAATTGIWVKTVCVIAGGFIIGLAAIGLTGIGVDDPELISPNNQNEIMSAENTPSSILQPSTTPTQNSSVSEFAPASFSESLNLDSNKQAYITLHTLSRNLSNQTICYFILPSPNDTTLSVTYADGHSETIPYQKASLAIEKQENTSFAKLIEDAIKNKRYIIKNK